jgi:hypothetical protein
MLFKALHYFANGLLLLLFSSCRFSKNVVNTAIYMKDGRSFRIFRRVVIASNTPPEATFVIRFHPKRMSARVNYYFSYLPMIVMLGFPGFRSKYWCVDDKTGFCQGVYEWQHVEDAKNYSHSFAVRFMEFRSTPGSITFDIYDQRSTANSDIYTFDTNGPSPL